MEEALQGKVMMMHAENNIGMIIKGVTVIAGMTGIITVILAADDGMTTAVEVPEVATLKKGTSFPSNSLLWTWTPRSEFVSKSPVPTKITKRAETKAKVVNVMTIGTTEVMIEAAAHGV